MGRVTKINSHAFLFISHIFLFNVLLGSAKDQISRLRNNMFIQKPVRLVFIIGLFHIIVSAALSLYLLYTYIIYGQFSIWVFSAMMIWVIGALVVTSLGYIGKEIVRQILKHS